MNQTKQILFRKDFTLMVIGQIVSLFGNAILRFALPLHLLRETGSSALFGAVTACSFVPMIIFSLVGGVLADRINKRNIMVALDFSTAVLIAAFYCTYGTLPMVPLMIVCLMVLYGISGTYQPAVQASIPALAPREQIMRGNAVINMVSTMSSLLGPVIGGVLFGMWGLTPILCVSIVCFICSAIMEIFIHIPHQKRQTETSIFSVVSEDLRESWRFIRDEKPIFISVVAILALFNLVLSAAMIVGIPIIVVQILDMSDTSLGLTQGALGLGGLIGGCLAGFFADKLKVRHGAWLLMACCVTEACMGVALLPFVPTMPAYVLITAMSFVTMAVSTLFTIQMCAMVQQQVPAHLVGKIMAMMIAVSACAQPIGQALYGMLFDVLADHSWSVMMGSAVLACLISLYSRYAFIRLDEMGQNT